MKYLNLLFIISFAVFGCQKAIEIDRDSVKPKLVINCIISPDSDSVKLSLTESRDLLYDQGTFPIVEDAVVQLFEDGVKVGNMVFTGGIYILIHTVQPGSNYEVIATSPRFDEASASTTVSSPLNSINFTAELLASNGVEGKLNFGDVPNEDNYFEVMMMYGSYLKEEDSVDINDPYYFPNYLNSYTCTNDYIVEFPESELLSSSICGGNFLFSDETFKNGNYTFNLSTPPNSFFYFADGEEYETVAVVECKSLNSDFYQYSLSKWIFLWNDGNPFAEPVPVYNNITNGYGIFGSQSIFIDTVFFE